MAAERRVRSSLRALASILVVTGGMSTLVASCLDPTQVSVVVSPGDLCAPGLVPINVVFNGGPPGTTENASPNATAEGCPPSGSYILVVAPSGDKDGRLELKVVGARGKDPSTCNAATNDSNCIWARRGLAYVPHTPLTVRIDLSTACLGVPCDTNTTCVSGACVSKEIDPASCEGDGCRLEGTGTRPDASTDGSNDAIASDGDPNRDGSPDAPPGDGASDSSTDGGSDANDGGVVNGVRCRNPANEETVCLLASPEPQCNWTGKNCGPDNVLVANQVHLKCDDFRDCNANQTCCPSPNGGAGVVASCMPEGACPNPICSGPGTCKTGSCTGTFMQNPDPALYGACQ